MHAHARARTRAHTHARAHARRCTHTPLHTHAAAHTAPLHTPPRYTHRPATHRPATRRPATHGPATAPRRSSAAPLQRRLPTPPPPTPPPTPQILHRCLPDSDTYSGGDVRVCGSPGCAAAQTAGQASACLSIDSRPDATDVWEICPAGTSEADCDAQANYCQYESLFLSNDRFLSANATSDTTKWTSTFSG